MKKYTRILSILTLVLLTIVMPATAQSDDNKNKAIVETTDGTQQLNTDEISIIRFEGDKVTFIQPWGESVFDRTLRSLTFLRPLPGTLRLTVQAGINENKSNRAQAIDAGKLKSTWESGDQVYVYADAVSTTSIGTLTPATTGSNSATLTGDINATGLVNDQTLYFSTKPRPFNFASQDGTVESLFYFTADAAVTVEGGNASLSGTLNFTRPVAIVKFSLKDGVGSAINVNSLTISAASNKLVKGYSAAPNNHSGYTITGNSANEYYGSGFNPVGQLLDGDINTKWCARKGEHTATFESNWYVEFNTTSAIQVDGYTLVTGGDTYEYPSRNPKDWTLQAKLDSGDDWTTIATVTNDNTLEGKNCEAYNYTVTTPGVYQYFRFEISSNQNYDGEYIMQLSEFKLWKNGDIAPAYGDVTVTPATATNELFVALRNENASADTYTLKADGGGACYIYNRSSVDFAYNNYYAIGVNMLMPVAAGNITVIDGNQGNDVPGGYGYDKLLDGIKSSKWCSLTNGGYSYPSGRDWVMWKTASSVVMTGYILTTGGDTGSNYGRNWKSWTVYGGNFADDATAQAAAAGDWTVIQQVVNDDVLKAENTTDYYYLTSNTIAYQYYKVVIDAIQDDYDNIQQMGELTMLTKNAAPDPTLTRPLTFEAKANGFTVTLTSTLDPKPSLQYSIDGGSWTDFTFSGDNATTPAVNTGHTISFRGDNTRFYYYDWEQHTSKFSCSQDCYLYGNMMSLLSESSYATITSVGESAFCRLFYGNTNIYSHDTKQLLLPATTLARSCYESLFNGCTHLTTAPNLPAKTLAEYCYLSMFNGCTGLVNAPVISAETLAANCCIFMFSECTSLTTGPTLSATTLVDYCYQYMFQNCSSLNSVTCLATDISASGCTFNWLDGVAATGTFAKALSMTSWTTGSSGIPSGWATKNVVNLASLTGDYEAQNNVVLTGTLAGNYKITIADGATVTLDNATINGTDDSNYWWSGLNCLGDATIILADGSENTVKGFDKHKAGIYFPENKTLTIQGSTGRLNVSSNGWAAGIGGSYGYDCGNIRIEGGIITATGCYQCPGIGASSGCGTITITGGTITSTGGEEAPGIGARNCGKITITGGTVTATGGQYGAGIGCKKDGITGGIEIGGTANVTAAGGEKAAGVGSGYCVSRNGTCGNISIGGTATVTATGGSKAAGIGSGYGFDSSSKSQCGTITIASTVTSITATKGADATNSIGKGEGSNSTCGTVTIGGTEGAITESPYTYAPAPVGAIDSKFTINASGDQVYFSQGNLQATTTDGWVTWTFSFMEHQYSTVETASQNVGSYYESQNTVSLFGWGTSGISDYTPIAGQYWPSTTGNSNDGYYAYGDETKNLYDENGKADWGYNAISNGGNTVNCGWRTLTTEEWQYLFENHSYGAHTVYGKNGIIILPDGVSSTTGFVSGLDNWTVVTNENWDAMEAAGAVFLPAAGYRSMSYVYEFGNNLYYWSSTHRDNDTAYCILFDKGYPYFSSNCPNVRCCGSSVRLVKDAN